MQIHKFVALALLVVLFIPGINAETPGALDRFILEAMKRHNMQGLSASIIKEGKIVWTKGYGYANVEKNIPFTPNTIHAEIASLSKTITATAIMQLWEQDRFQLDDAVNDYLPFTVINPWFPNNPITFRMLLTHTSSLYTNYDTGDDKFNFNDKYFPTLGKYLFSILNSGGGYYNDTVCFHKYKPGSQWSYCGAGYALLGYLVEIISKTPFDEYCNQNIFSPLSMSHTAWHFRDVDTNIVSRPYHWSDEKNGYADCELYEYPTYPEGQLKTSVVDLSKFLCMNMNGGKFDSIRILKNSTVKLMHSDHISISDKDLLAASYGFGWGHIKISNRDLWGHHGRDLGISTEMLYEPDKNTGVILFANGEDDATSLIPCSNKDDIVCKLFEVADTIKSGASPELNYSYISSPCERGINYWRSNSRNWALNAIPMKLGTKNFYSQNQILAILNIKDSGDASTVLTQQLIAVKFNVANGSELSPIITTVNAASELIGNRTLPCRPVIALDSKEGIQMIALANKLELYNRGLMNQEKCSGSSGSKGDFQ